MRPKGTWVPVEGADSQNWAIIIDPGHGGVDDPGCEGSTGLLEKDVVLALAKQIQGLSTQQEMQIYLTRGTDTKKTHFERIQVAKSEPRQPLSQSTLQRLFLTPRKGDQDLSEQS